ncbi:MAG TPA: nitrile hydratase subunit beta [Acidimicrobiales bacterium]|nr:nitrile hydratase subunit beta [Acidimicrobiales bacterium]
MDGIHDMGGMAGFGPVVVEADEPVFHHDWERRACRLTMAAMLSGHLNGRFRHAIERMDPAWYLASGYYEHWLVAAATGLVEAGVVGQDELDERLGAPYPLAQPVRAARLARAGESSDAHRFVVGERVRVRDIHPAGHTRAPRYVQGRRGTVVRLDGVFSVPDVEYHCDDKRFEPTYCVRFEAAELWGEDGDPVHVDLWESYLEADDG